MQSSFVGTVMNGALQLDARVELADQSRVHVTIVPIEDWKSQWRRSLAALEQLKKTNPIHSGGLRYTREQLHERR